MPGFNINVIFRRLSSTLKYCDKVIAQLPDINFRKIQVISSLHFSHDLLYAFDYIVVIVIAISCQIYQAEQIF